MSEPNEMKPLAPEEATKELSSEHSPVAAIPEEAVVAASSEKVTEPVPEVIPAQTKDQEQAQIEKPVATTAAVENQPGPARVTETRPVDPARADDASATKIPDRQAADAAVLAESRKHTRRSFAIAALGAAAGYGFYYWLPRSRSDQDQPLLLRRTLQANAALSRRLFDERALAPTYPLSRAENLRVNGVYGIKRALAPESWRLQLVGARDETQHPRFTSDVTAWEYRYKDADAHADQGHDTKVAPSANTAVKMAPKPMIAAASEQQQRVERPPRGVEEAGKSNSTLPAGTSGLLLTMEDITRLPRHELVTQFKCIEGWSQIVHWSGVRMADFLELYPPEHVDGREPRYVYMETPNGDYYTGYDMHVMRHPQTLLVTEMMGAPLTQTHGAPLRLHMPTKYGYKQIKCIGLIQYTDEKPDDYWTKLGYDWYAGL